MSSWVLARGNDVASQVQPFGSSLSRLDWRGSDIDVVITGSMQPDSNTHYGANEHYLAVLKFRIAKP